MRLVCVGSIPLTLILMFGCAKHDLRCDAHLTPINAPAPPGATHRKPSGGSSP